MPITHLLASFENLFPGSERTNRLGRIPAVVDERTVSTR